MKEKNEENACNALIEILERIAGVRYERESSPDADGAKGRSEVDFILKSTPDGTHRIAVEHTIIELFPGQKENAMWSYDIGQEINTRCRGKIPSDRYYILTVPPTLISSFSTKKKKMAFVDSLAPWIVLRAWQLKVDKSLPYTYRDHKITLTCGGAHPSLNGTVGRIPEEPEDLKTLQKDRFHKAIQHTLKKLTRYKSKGFTTVMLLEDIAGVNHQYLIKELTSLEKDQIDRFIDYIIALVSYGDKMIVGNVWKENFTWHSFIPCDRRFDLRSPP